MARRKASVATTRGSRIEVSDILERVTRAEERVIALDRTQVEWRDEQRAAHTDLSTRLAALEKALTKYQGAWGLLTIILSAVGAALAMFHEAIMKKLGLSSE